MDAIERQDYGVRLEISYPVDQLTPTPKHGDSVAINGCCLTHTGDQSTPSGKLIFHVIHETLEKTTIGNLQVGSSVNLEPAVTASTPMGGHFVQGHVDTTGKITAIQNNADDYRITIQTPDNFTPYIVPKGSICIDGVSLTIAATDAPNNSFQIALIPTTLEITNLGKAVVGNTVNLEADMIAKTVVNFLQHQFGDSQQSELTMDKLKAAGFLNS